MAHTPDRTLAVLSPTEPGAPPALILDRLAAGATVPAVSTARWLDALHAPQAHPNARHDYGVRAAALLGLLTEPGLAELVEWAWSRWPGEVPILAGVLSAAPALQTAARRQVTVDHLAAAELVSSAVAVARELDARRQRAGADRRRRTEVVHGVQIERLPAPDTDGPTGEAPERAEQVAAWVAGQLRSAHGASRPGPALLIVEANLPAFWAWYARRVPMAEVTAGRFPAPPLSRQLGSGQRLEDYLSGTASGTSAQLRQRLATVSRLMVGPRRRRNHQPGQGWCAGIGHWSLVALAAWSAARDAPTPPSSTTRWWVQQLALIDARPAPWEPPAVPSARHDIVA